jgi:hypothetical protein
MGSYEKITDPYFKFTSGGNDKEHYKLDGLTM